MNESIVRDIREIIDDTAKTYEIGGKTYTNRPLNLVRHKDTARTLEFNDLSSITRILKNELSRFQAPMYIVIEDYNRVSVISSLDDDKDRETPYRAVCDYSPFKFGNMYDYEDFVIALRSMFVQNEETADLLQLLKTITDSNSVELADDGITQKVTAKRGVSAQATNAAPIRKLAPFRTFPEVEQPTSEFLFRIRTNNTFSLFEADGGAWKRKAKLNIIDYYENALKEEIEAGKIIVIG